MVISVLRLAAAMAAPGWGDGGSERERAGGVLVSLSAPRTPPSVPRAPRAGRTLGTGGLGGSPLGGVAALFLRWSCLTGELW